MSDAKNKLQDLGIEKGEIEQYDLIILLSKSWETMVRLLQKTGCKKDPYQFLAPVIKKIYQEPLYNRRLKRITLMLSIPDEVKDIYFRTFENQPDAFLESNEDIPMAKKEKFVHATDNAVLNVIKDYLGYGDTYFERNRISESFENPDWYSDF